MFSRVLWVKALPDVGAGLAEDDCGEEQRPLGVPAVFAYAFELESRGGDKAFPNLACWEFVLLVVV